MGLECLGARLVPTVGMTWGTPRSYGRNIDVGLENQDLEQGETSKTRPLVLLDFLGETSKPKLGFAGPRVSRILSCLSNSRIVWVSLILCCPSVSRIQWVSRILCCLSVSRILWVSRILCCISVSRILCVSRIPCCSSVFRILCVSQILCCLSVSRIVCVFFGFSVGFCRFLGFSAVCRFLGFCVFLGFLAVSRCLGFDGFARAKPQIHG